jgi:hypothetical protein
MGRLIKDVCYRKRGKVWYYKFKGEMNFTSSGLTAKAKAESYVNELLKKMACRRYRMKYLRIMPVSSFSGTVALTLQDCVKKGSPSRNGKWQSRGPIWRPMC